MNVILQPSTDLPRSVKRQQRLADAVSHEVMASPEQTDLALIEADVEFSDLDSYMRYTVFTYRNTITDSTWSIAVRDDGKVVKVLE